MAPALLAQQPLARLASLPAGRRAAARQCRRQLVVSAAGGSGERQPWDVRRFAETVLYFNPLPTPDQVLRRLFGGAQASPAPAMASSAASGAVQTLIAPSGGAGTTAPQPTVLVTGATGGVGKRVVAQLLQRPGARVRALVRDAQKGRQLLGALPAAPGARLELVAADLTQPRTLLPEMFEGVGSVVACSAVKVAPKEGDTVDRQKYYQGIKFYDPEIVGDTPETVEWRGMQNLLAALGGRLAPKLLFSARGGGAIAGWGSLDDVVMGGASASSFSLVPGAGEDGGPAGVFAGRVTTANNGGFASVRCRNIEPPLDLTGYEGLELRVKGNGLRYKLILRCDPGWDSVGYTAYFDTTPDGWQTVRVPFSDFAPVFRARTQRGMPPLNAANVCSVQLMFSKFETDGALNPTFREGPFELPIERMSAYLPSGSPARFVLVSSAGVTRPHRPGIDVEAEPPAVKMNAMLGGILDFKLRAEDELRASGVPHAVVRPVALTEEPGGMPLVLDQGDTIRGKVSRDDVAALCCALLEQPAGAGMTFEVGSTVPFSQAWEGAGADAPARDWGALLAGAGLRPRVTGKTVNGRYLGKEPEPEGADAGAPAAAAV